MSADSSGWTGATRGNLTVNTRLQVVWPRGPDPECLCKRRREITALRAFARPLSRRFIHRADGLAQPEPGAKPQLGGGSPPIDHADVADEIELRDREARHTDRERERQERLRDRMRDRTDLRGRARAGWQTAAPRPGRRCCRCRARPGASACTIASATSSTWTSWTIGSKPSSTGGRSDAQVVRRRVVNRPDDVDRPQHDGLELARAPQERRHEVIDLDEIAHRREPLARQEAARPR